MSTSAEPLVAGAIPLNRSEYIDLWRETFGKLPPKNISMGFMQRAIDFERQCEDYHGKPCESLKQSPGAVHRQQIQSHP